MMRSFSGELLLEIEQASVVAGLDQLVDERGGGGEADRQPRWQAARPRPRATCVLPVPLLPMAITFSRRSTYSQRANCMTSCLFTGRDGEEVEAVQALCGREACSPYPPVQLAVMAVYEFKLREPQQVAGMVDTLDGTAAGQLAVLAQERRQPQFLEMVLQEHAGLIAHDLPPTTSVM